MPRFEYHSPDTLDEVVALLAEHGDEAKVVAGGQSLVPLLAMRLARPAHLVDVNRVAGLSGITDRGDHVAFGAITREREAERSALVRDRVPLLAEALPLVGHVAIRNRGTIGGSLAHADASAEIPAVTVALGGEAVVRSTRGERVLAAHDFLLGHFTTAMADDEVLVEVRLPVTASGTGSSFQEVARRHGDFALVGVGAQVALDSGGTITRARIALMGVADTAIRAEAAEQALVGARPAPEAFAEAADLATADLEPASDIHGSAAFRKHLARVIVRRALTTAASRAGGAA